MNGDIYLEIFGYIGTVLIIISMMMTSLTRLRIINMCGSVISTIYSIAHGAWAVAVMNICLFIINGVHLVRDVYNKRKNPEDASARQVSNKTNT